MGAGKNKITKQAIQEMVKVLVVTPVLGAVTGLTDISRNISKYLGEGSRKDLLPVEDRQGDGVQEQIVESDGLQEQIVESDGLQGQIVGGDQIQEQIVEHDQVQEQFVEDDEDDEQFYDDDDDHEQVHEDNEVQDRLSVEDYLQNAPTLTVDPKNIPRVVDEDLILEVEAMKNPDWFVYQRSKLFLKDTCWAAESLYQTNQV